MFHLSKPSSGERAFTMIEIALCLAVISFALIAIIGVLPTGLRVQQDNREDTVINQDGAFFMEAIKSGAWGLDDLTNRVEEIAIITGDAAVPPLIYTNFESGRQIVGLLSYPRYEQVAEVSGGRGLSRRTWVTNQVIARVKALSGRASQQASDFAFRYQLTSEIVPLNVTPSLDTNFLNAPTPDVAVMRSNQWLKAKNYETNFHEIRLTLQWPVYEHGNEIKVGNNRKVFRSLVSGVLRQGKFRDSNKNRLYFIEPLNFSQVQ